MSGITCFLVDDDIDDIEIFAIAIEQLGGDITCISVMNGDEAVRQLNSNPLLQPDFIFLDMNMPRMNGKQCLVAIKKIERFAQTPVIMYSTSAEPRDIEETKRLGAMHFLTKPVTIDALTKELSLLLLPKNTLA